MIYNIDHRLKRQHDIEILGFVSGYGSELSERDWQSRFWKNSRKSTYESVVRVPTFRILTTIYGQLLLVSDAQVLLNKVHIKINISLHSDIPKKYLHDRRNTRLQRSS